MIITENTEGRAAGIGEPLPVHDAWSKAAGETRYIDDIKLPGMLYAKVLFSPVAHALIKEIDAGEAEGMPGVHAVLSYKNCTDKAFNSTTRFYTQKPIESEKIFDSAVRFMGDRVAAVAAESEEEARRAIRKIKVEYTPLPVCTDPEEALADGAWPIHKGGNACVSMTGKCGDTQKALEQADRVFEDRYTMKPVLPSALEPHGSIASYDADGRLTVYTCTQNAYGLRVVLSRLFELPQSRIRVIATPLGGAFGGKIEATTEAVAAALAIRTRRPVKLIYTRMETSVATRTRHGAVVYLKTGMMNDGTLLAQDIRVITNTGAYAASAANVLGAMSGKVFKLYKTPNILFRGVAAYTNTPIAGAMRGYGSPQVFAAIQRQLQRISLELKIPFAELQKRNLMEPGDLDLRTGASVGNAQGRECLARCELMMREWQPVPDGYAGWDIGEGMAVGVHCSGAAGAQPDHTGIVLRMNDDGSCVIHSGTHDMGNGGVTAQMQIVSRTLQISPERVRPMTADTDVTPWNLGEFSSRGIFTECEAVRLAAEKMRYTLLEIAAEKLGCAAEELHLTPGGVCGPDDTVLCTILDVITYAQQAMGKTLIESVSYAGTITPASYGVHAARVAVNRKTGETRVLDYAAVHDVGKVINRMGIEGQLEGSIQMGIGYALCEELLFNENGKCMNASLKGYRMPHASDMPRLKMDFVEKGEPGGPFGAKSIAECAIVPSAPAILNAVHNAVGADIHDMPCTPDKLRRMLNESDAG